MDSKENLKQQIKLAIEDYARRSKGQRQEPGRYRRRRPAKQKKSRNEPVRWN